LNTTALPAATIPDGSAHFDTKLYTGNGGTQSISGYDFSPDLVWLKARSVAYSHQLYDPIRGVQKAIVANTSAAEATYSGGLTAFNTDGFTIGNDGGINNNNSTFVGWAWNAGSSNTSISVGSLNSSFYDQSQTWSSAAADSYGFDGSTAYNSAATRLYGTSTYHKIVDANNPFTNVTSVVVGTSENVGNIKLDGTVYTTSYTSGVGLTVTSPPSSFSDIEVLGASNGVQIAYVKISGVILVDSGVSLSGVTQYPSIASTVRANPSAGFSIVSYTGSGSAATLGHGLNAAPEFVIIKNRDTSNTFWVVGHQAISFTSDNYLRLNGTNASSSGGGVAWNNTAPTSSVVHIGTSNILNTSGDSLIAYCFAPVAGYSAIGSYEGNGSSDGPFVYLGFKPALVILKLVEGVASSWKIYDNKRDTDNPIEKQLYPNSNNAEPSDDTRCDFLSNGFKVRTAGSEDNYNNNTVIYYAVAENPFQANGGLAR
jgi:hypothetical protein